MKKILYTLLLFLAATGVVKAQDTAPASPKVITPNMFYSISGGDTSIYQKTPFGWAKLMRYGQASVVFGRNFTGLFTTVSPGALNFSHSPTTINNFAVFRSDSGDLVLPTINYNQGTNTVTYSPVINANNGLRVTYTPTLDAGASFAKIDPSTGYIEKDTAQRLKLYISGLTRVKGNMLGLDSAVVGGRLDAIKTIFLPGSVNAFKSGKSLSFSADRIVSYGSDTTIKRLDWHIDADTNRLGGNAFSFKTKLYSEYTPTSNLQVLRKFDAWNIDGLATADRTHDINGHTLLLKNGTNSTGDNGLTLAPTYGNLRYGDADTTSLVSASRYGSTLSASSFSLFYFNTVTASAQGVFLDNIGGGADSYLHLGNGQAIRAFDYQKHGIVYDFNDWSMLTDSSLVPKKFVTDAIAAAGGGGGITTNALTNGYAITSTGTFNGSTARTFAVDSILQASKPWAFAAFNTKAQVASTYVPLTRTVAGFALSSNVSLASLTLGNGLLGTSYNPSGATTAKLDTFVAQTVLNFFPKADTRYLKISAAPIGANPTASIGFTAVNGSSTNFTRADGAPKADSTVIASTANHPTFAQLQTKVNNYLLISDTTSLARKIGNAAMQQASYSLIGTGGNGYIDMLSQSARPTGTAGHLRLYRDSVGSIAYMNGIYRRTLKFTKVADITTTFPYKLVSVLADSTDVATSIAGLSSTYVPLTRTITFNGTPFDLSANRTFTVTTANTDTTATGFRTAANSFTLAQARTALNLKLNVSDTSAMAYVHKAINETITGLKTTRFDNIGATVTPGFVIANLQTLTTGQGQLSPSLKLSAPAFGTTLGTSQAMDWHIYSSGIAGTTPTTQLVFASAVNGATPVGRFSISNNASLNASGSAANILIGKTGLAATTSSSFTSSNTTAATSGVPEQRAGAFEWLGHVWNTTATAADNVFGGRIDMRGISGTTPDEKMFFMTGKGISSVTYTDKMSLNNAGDLAMLTGTIILKSFTVSGLPTGVQGMVAYVTDASSPTSLATVAGGGSAVVKVFYNGTNWIVQ